MAMKVVDISKHNGTVAWAALKSADITGVIIRAGYGNVIDPLWTTNYAGAVKNGFKVGVYWFAYPLSAAGAQAEADTCWGAIGGKQLDLGVYYDYEYDSTDYLKRKGIKETKQLVTDMMKAFIGRMKTHGVNCGIYVNRDYIQNHMYYNELKQYPLWQAAWVTNGYTSYDVVTQGQKPSTYKIVCWQFGKGYLGGKVDLIMMRIVDIIYSLPDMLIIILHSCARKRDSKTRPESTSITTNGLNTCGRSSGKRCSKAA